jgi:hypothetical protein
VTIMKYELKHLSTGQLIGESFNIYFNNFLPLFLISLIIYIPSFLYNIFLSGYLVGGTSTPRELINDPVSLIILILSAIILGAFAVIGTGLIIEIVSRRYLGEHVRFDVYLKNTAKKIIRLVFLSIISIIIVYAGFFLFIIPGIILVLGLSVATEALVVEDLGILQSIKRSWELTKKKKWHVFGVFFLIGLIILGISILGNILIEAVINFLSLSMAKDFQLYFIAYQAGSGAITVIYQPFVFCAVVLLYFNLRIEKEGFDIEHLARHFTKSNH